LKNAHLLLFPSSFAVQRTSKHALRLRILIYGVDAQPKAGKLHARMADWRTQRAGARANQRTGVG
jgi:hypothetical protein